MNKILLTLVLAGVLFSLTPVIGHAQALTPGPQEPPLSDIWVVIRTIIWWLFGLLLAFAVIMLIVAGFMFITAAGDPERVARARYFVLYALIGVLVAFMARGLIWAIDRIVTP